MMQLALEHPKMSHGCVICGYAFTPAEYHSFIEYLNENLIDFYVTQVGPGNYYRFSFRLFDVKWYLPFDPSGINKSPVKP